MARTLEQIIAAEKTEVVVMAREQAETMLLNINLAELAEKTQIDDSGNTVVK